MGRNQRTPEAQAYHRWYKLKAWLGIRAQQLRNHPLCERCLPKIVPANTVNHITPHKGDWLAFINGPFESLCASCHSSQVQSEERLGYRKGCDASGHPVAADHPWNVGAGGSQRVNGPSQRTGGAAFLF